MSLGTFQTEHGLFVENQQPVVIRRPAAFILRQQSSSADTLRGMRRNAPAEPDLNESPGYSTLGYSTHCKSHCKSRMPVELMSASAPVGDRLKFFGSIRPRVDTFPPPDIGSRRKISSLIFTLSAPADDRMKFFGAIPSRVWPSGDPHPGDRQPSPVIVQFTSFTRTPSYIPLSRRKQAEFEPTGIGDWRDRTVFFLGAPHSTPPPPPPARKSELLIIERDYLRDLADETGSWSVVPVQVLSSFVEPDVDSLAYLASHILRKRNQSGAPDAPDDQISAFGIASRTGSLQHLFNSTPDSFAVFAAVHKGGRGVPERPVEEHDQRQRRSVIQHLHARHAVSIFRRTEQDLSDLTAETIPEATGDRRRQAILRINPVEFDALAPILRSLRARRAVGPETRDDEAISLVTARRRLVIYPTFWTPTPDFIVSICFGTITVEPVIGIGTITVEPAIGIEDSAEMTVVPVISVGKITSEC